MMLRIRDFLVSKEDCIHAVVAYTPDPDEGIPTTLRYIPDEDGERSHCATGMRYRKENDSTVHIVDMDDIEEVLMPSERLDGAVERYPPLEYITACLEDYGVHRNNMGVTGSILCGLEDPAASDIDFVVYGGDWFVAREAVMSAKRLGDYGIMDINLDMWERIYRKRTPELDFWEFLLHEVRKGNRGMVDNVYFDLLYARDWDEMDSLRNWRGVPDGIETISAIVVDDTFSFDNPAVYEVEHDQIDYVLSFTHTYAGQAVIGEMIEARGMVEHLEDGTSILVVGTSREAHGEWIRSRTLIDESDGEVVRCLRKE